MKTLQQEDTLQLYLLVDRLDDLINEIEKLADSFDVYFYEADLSRTSALIPIQEQVSEIRRLVRNELDRRKEIK